MKPAMIVLFLIILTLVKIRETDTKFIRNQSKDLNESTITPNGTKMTVNKSGNGKYQASAIRRTKMKSIKREKQIARQLLTNKLKIQKDIRKKKQIKQNKTEQRDERKQKKKNKGGKWKEKERKKHKKIRLINNMHVFNVEDLKIKLKEKRKSTCTRAKTRATLSYQTMNLLFEQSFSESQIYEGLEKSQVEYSNFWRATNDFVSTKRNCDTNPSWNPIILKRELVKFEELISDLNSCFPLSTAPNQEDPISLATSSNQQRGLNKCMDSQKKQLECTHCNKQCGSAMKNGEIVILPTAVNCFYDVNWPVCVIMAPFLCTSS